jgi:manganese/zinc/iron transport system substrate-binding protein
MKYCLKIFIMLFLALLACCSPATGPKKNQQFVDWMAPNGKFKVLCTNAFISDLVRTVGDDVIDCLTLIQGQSDPHSYQLVKGDDEKMKRADKIFFNGLGLEHGPSLAHNLHKNPKAIALGDYLLMHYPKEVISVDHTFDPHVWMDVSLWQKTIPCIVHELSNALPQHQAQFQERGLALSAQLSKLHEEMRTCLQSIEASKRYLVTTHDAFNYFTRAYLAQIDEQNNNNWQVRCRAPEGLAPDSQLSTADIQRLVDHLLRYHIQVVFAESNVSRASIGKMVDAVAKHGQEIKIADRPLYADAMGPLGSECVTYMGLMRYNMRIISENLSNSTLAKVEYK